MLRKLLLALALLAGSAGSAFAQASLNPFTPDTDSTVVTAATTLNANITLGCANTVGPFQVRVYNGATAIAHIRIGGSATTSNMPIPPGTVEVLSFQTRATTLGVILASGTGNFYTTCGAGS